MNENWDGDRDPLAALRAGRPGPYEDFVRSESRRFLAFFDRLGASRSESEDLVQETFLKLFRLAETSHAYRAEGRFLSFAFRVARNAWIDRRRRAAHRPAEASGGDDAETVFDRTAGAFEAPYERAETREESQLVQAAVGALPEGHRLVFELGVVEERPYAEISEILDIPVGTVKSRMHNAVRKVRAALEGGAEA